MPERMSSATLKLYLTKNSFKYCLSGDYFFSLSWLIIACSNIPYNSQVANMCNLSVKP